MIRATTGGVMKTYRSNLMGSFVGMNAARNTVLTQRTFNSFAEDPASAAKAFRLRKSRMMVNSQHTICYDTMKKYDSAVACLQSIDDVLCTKDGVYGQYMKTLTGTTLSMLNDPTGDAREQLNKVLDQMSQSIIQTMNQKYGDNFIFAGADGHNVPFEIKDNKLYYRGVWVDASIPNVLTDKDGKPVMVGTKGRVNPSGEYYVNMDNVEAITQEDYDKLYTVPNLQMDPTDSSKFLECDYDDGGNMVYTPEGGKYYMPLGEDGQPTGEAILKEDYDAIVARYDSLLKNKDDSVYYQEDENGVKTYYVIKGDHKMDEETYNAQKLEYEKLQYLANEKYFVDIGYGFQEVDGKLIESSAFNAALNGINFIGWGLDEDGDPKNLYSLVQKMREVSDSVPVAGKWDDATWTEFDRLVGKFEDAVSNYQTEFVDLDASTGKLSMQEQLLVDNFDNLQEQYSDLEDVDMVESITSFLWAEYCYNAALKVGNSILGQSLMDYLS